MRTHDDKARSLRSKCLRQHETVEEVLLPQVHLEFLLWKGCKRDAKSRLREARSDEEIFTFVDWIKAFNINEPIYAEICHEFYSTYEFDKVCADEELQTKKIIKFRLGGRAHNLTLLEFAQRLGLYQAVEFEEEGFNVYFKGGEKKPRKGQNRIKTGQKREACQSQENFKAVAVDKGRKTEENAKRMVENAYTVKKLF
nr:hypothetical protein [Tanacetum cinerariifolium]